MPNPYDFVMLIDEDEIDNIINQKIIESNNFAQDIKVFRVGQNALDFLKEEGKKDEKDRKLPDLIFLDINMPLMDGFQFLDEFDKEDMPQSVKDKCKIVMLSSSISPRDIDRAASNKYVKKYLNKPLNARYLDAITI